MATNNNSVLNIPGSQLPDTKTLCFMSYNMHGFNQGVDFLNQICNSIDCPDFIYVQEHWLTSANLNKLKQLNKNYVFLALQPWIKSLPKIF